MQPGDQHDGDGYQQKHRIRAPRLEIDGLETSKADRADHQERWYEHHEERRERRTKIVEAEWIDVHRRRRNGRGGWTRHPDEIPPVSPAGALNVEAGQAHRRSGHEDETRRPTETT